MRREELFGLNTKSPVTLVSVIYVVRVVGFYLVITMYF